MTTKTSLQLDAEAIAKADEQARKWGLSRQQYINIVLKHCEIDLSVILKTEALKKSGRPKSSTIKKEKYYRCDKCGHTQEEYSCCWNCGASIDYIVFNS